MKRKLWIMLAAVTLLTVLWCGCAAADVSGTCGDSLTWTLTDAGKLTISGTGEMTDFSSYEAVPWYAEMVSITSLQIGSGVTSIGTRAFAYTDLTEVTIPGNVTTIGYLAFKECSSLTEVTILNKSATIGDTDHDVFLGCASDFTLRGFTGSTAESYATEAEHHFGNPKCGENATCDLSADGVLTISGSGRMTGFNRASDVPWYSCRKNILSVIIENGITNIATAAFVDCSNCTGVIIPNSVTSISVSAFNGCSGLTSVTIPESVTYIDYWAFKDCTSLTRATIKNPNATIGYNDLEAFIGCTASGFTIRGWAGSTAETYANEHNISFISLGNLSGSCGENVNYAFDPVTGKLTISGTGAMTDYSNATIVPWYTFSESITSVIIRNGVTSIGKNAFFGCFGLPDLTIPQSVTSIGNSAFSACTGLRNVNIPESVTSIGYLAFEDCSGLTSVTIHNATATIGDSDYDVFYNCAAGLTLYGYDGSTAETYATAAKIPFLTVGGQCGDNVNWIFDPAAGEVTITGTGPMTDYYNQSSSPFQGRSDITSVKLGEGVTGIGQYAFYGCNNLSAITIPAGVSSVGTQAFYYCWKLVDVTVLGKTTSFTSNAFSTGDYHPTFHVYHNSRAHTYASGKDGFIVDFLDIIGECGAQGDNVTYSLDTLTGVVTFSGTGAMRNYDGETNLSPFYGNEAVTAAVFNSGITTIGDFLFYWQCPNLASVTLSDTITSIGEAALYATALTEISIPDSVTRIEMYAFRFCRKLESVTIPKSVTFIGREAFQYCSELMNVTILNPNTDIRQIAFNNVPGTIHGWTPSTAKTYAEENNMTFESLGDLLGQCGDNVYCAFDPVTGVLTASGTGEMRNFGSGYSPTYNLRSLLISAVIEDGVTTIGQNFFYDCANLSSVSIPNSVYTIRQGAFDGCTSLTGVTIPNSVDSIYYQTFRNCTSLTGVTILNPTAIIGNSDYDVFENCASDFTLYGYYNSTASEYATAAGHPFSLLAPAPDFFLPSALTTIESEAFTGIAAKAVVIPNTITTITGNPFAGSTVNTVYGYPGTAAETYANTYSKTFVPLSDTYLEKLQQ